VRILVTLAAFALSIPSWSANLVACSNSDASAVQAKIRQYILPAPDSPQHRWIVWKAGNTWLITEYSGLRVHIQCRPVSKADELNGVQYGEIEFSYDASRSADLPKLTSAGLQRVEWTEWTDPSISNRRIAFRKRKGSFQLEWEYDDGFLVDTLMPAADVGRFFSTANAEAAKLRMAEAKAKAEAEAEAEAEQARRAQEEAEPTRQEQQRGAQAKLRSAVDPDQFYPPGAKRREEQGSPVVQACVGPNGRLVREPVVTETSGFRELDDAAVKIAKANRYVPATEAGTPLPESCVKYKIKFVIGAE